MMNLRHPLSIGRVIPLVIALTAATDFSTHFLPQAWYSFRAYEPVHRYCLGLVGMTPNFHYDNPRAYGDLASLGNRPDIRAYRREVLNTDGQGFRSNGRNEPPGPVESAVMGDSFAEGCALSDPQTLSAQLERLIGRRVHNGADFRIEWIRVRKYLDLLGMHHGTLIFETMERFPLPSGTDMRDHPEQTESRRRLVMAWRIWKGLFRSGCPMEIVAQHAFKRVEDGHLLPNPYAGIIDVRELRNGQPMAFIPTDVVNLGEHRTPDLDGVRLLQERLTQRGLKLLVVLVPDKFHVYHKLLANPPPEPQGPGTLDLAEEALRQANIPVLNLEPILSQGAEKALSKGELIYWPDDTHWNPEGVRLAAEAIAGALR